VLRLAEAADGLLARVRLPGGLIDGEQLCALARLASELGDGRVELTSRGNVQLRGLAGDAAVPLTDGLARAGLLPSFSHDRVRNVLASPLAGLDGGTDLTGIVRALDAALCARPRLAQLSGRFLFAVDDGRGDVAGLGADVVATVRADSAVVNGLSVRRADVTDSATGTDAGGVPDGLRDDIVTAILLLLVGIGTTALAVWGRRQQAAASRNEGFLEGIATASQSVSAGDLAPSALIDRVCAELTTVLGLRSCRFDFGTGLNRPHLHRDGRVTWRHQVWDVRVGVPATHGALELWAQTGGSFRGRFLLEVNDGFRMSTGQLRLATSLADDVAAALAGYDARTP